MSYLLDTNIVSELRKGKRANARVRSWFEAVPATDVFLSVVVLGEIRRGIERVRGRDSKQAMALERWLQRLTLKHSDHLLSVDRRVADTWGRLMAERHASPVDVLMAATAQVHELTLVTRNTRDVAWTRVPCVNPFEVEPGPRE